MEIRGDCALTLADVRRRMTLYYQTQISLSGSLSLSLSLKPPPGVPSFAGSQALRGSLKAPITGGLCLPSVDFWTLECLRSSILVRPSRPTASYRGLYRGGALVSVTGYPRNGAPGPGEAFKPGLPEIKEKSGIENLVPVG